MFEQETGDEWGFILRDCCYEQILIFYNKNDNMKYIVIEVPKNETL